MNETEQQPELRQQSRWQRIAKIVFNIVAVFVSLMTFPSGLPWMILFWLGVFLYVTTHSKNTGTGPLLICIAIVVIKRPDRSPALFVMLAVLLVVSIGIVICWLRTQRTTSKDSVFSWKIYAAVSIAMFATWCYFALLYHHHASAGVSNRYDPNRAIVCLGDSLTAYGYPKVLAEKINVPVVDMGQDGIKTDHGLKRLDEIVALQPQTVVLELGGHDFNQGESREHAKRNLEKMITTFRANDIDVIIIEVPRGFITDGFDGLERELARKFDLELVSDWTIRSFVLMSPICPPGMFLSKNWHRSKDGLHPNKRGNQVFANSVAAALRNLYGEQILK